MELLEINSLEDFETSISRFPTENDDGILTFRGQVTDRPLIPAMLRGSGSNAHAPGCIPALTMSWSACASKLVSEFKGSAPTSLETQAVLQHYGYRSFFVDTTSDPYVSLWFALHRLRAEDTPLHVDKLLRSALFQWVKCEPSSTGFVYCIRVPDTREFVDLTQTIPRDASRVQVQKAAALFAGRGAPPLDGLIIAKLCVKDEGWFKSSGHDRKVTDIFPSPSSDLFYRCLCTVPYYFPSNAFVDVARPLLGMFPIYSESVYQLVRDFAPLTRVLSSEHPALEWNVSATVIEFENREVEATKAARIILSPFLIEALMQQEELASNPDYSCWPSSNLLLELDLDASLSPPSRTPIAEIFRGLWTVIEKQSLLMWNMVDNFEEIQLKHRRTHSIDDYSVIKGECNCDHSPELMLFRKATQLLGTGKLSLEKSSLGYFVLNETRRSGEPLALNPQGSR